MAEQTTQRLGLPIYTSGSDEHPSRADFNERMETLDEQVARAAQGLTMNRPSPSTPGSFFYATDTGLLWFDTGTEWVRIVRVGMQGPGEPVDVAGEGQEGSSPWAARADHSHPLPLATGSQPGALSAADKALLDAATSSSDSNSLAKRDSNGRTSVGTPTSSSHAATKAYVDAQRDTRAPTSHTHNASDVNAGVFAPDRLPPATTSSQGAMRPSDKSKLDAAAWNGGPGTLVQRASNTGRFQAGDPMVSEDVATKGYVDQQRDTRAPSSHSHAAGDITGTLAVARIPSLPASQTTSGIFHVDRIPTLPVSKIEGTLPMSQLPTSTMQTGGTVVARDSSGRSRFNDPSATLDAANKRYVDQQRDTRAPTSHTHNASDINEGTINHLRLPAATQSTQGAMSGTDKSLLDSASPDPIEGNRIIRTFSHGQAQIINPWTDMHIANKRYVDQQRDTRAPSSHSHAAGDITGTLAVARIPSLPASQTTSGIFHVDRIPGLPASRITGETFAPARLPAATTSQQGALSAADKALLDGAAWDGGNGTLVLRASSTGRVQVGAPMDPDDATTKQYVDEQVEEAVAARPVEGQVTELVHPDPTDGSTDWPRPAYMKVGNMVYLQGRLNRGNRENWEGLTLSGLPAPVGPRRVNARFTTRLSGVVAAGPDGDRDGVTMDVDENGVLTVVWASHDSTHGVSLDGLSYIIPAAGIQGST